MNLPLAIVLFACAAPALAQTPATNLMPDGSRDLYLGLGAISHARYEGARERKVRALPVVQLELSSGVFISGLSAGMHLSQQPACEFGPLLAIDPGRDADGVKGGAGGVGGVGGSGIAAGVRSNGALAGLDTIGVRVQVGGFFNSYLSPQLRLTNSVLAGGGNDHHGLTWQLDIQRIALDIAPHHSLSFNAGLTAANASYLQSWFGVTDIEAKRGGRSAYAPGAGIKDVHLGARWNWALSPAWLLTTHVQAARLMAGAADSPLVERRSSASLSSALAYRF